MSDLPDGWEWSTLGAVDSYLNGRGFKKTEWADSGKPIIRIQNLTGSTGGTNYFAGEADERHIVRSGDLLVSWAATLGVFIWQGPEAVLNQHIFKVESFIDPGYHRYLLENALADLRRQAHGSGMVHVTKSKFDETSVPIPPLSEQRRIVAAIEKHFSCLDAAEAGFQTALARTTTIIQSVLITLIPCPDVPVDWELTSVNQAGATDLGRQRAPKYHSGDSMRPYLRVANVFEDRLDLSDVMEMDIDDGAWSKYRLCQGDILLNEGQSPHLVGRPAMYRGDPRAIAFTNSLIRFRANDDVDPEWALLVFRRHLHARRFMKEASITTNIAHLALKRFRTVEFPSHQLQNSAESFPRSAAISKPLTE